MQSLKQKESHYHEFMSAALPRYMQEGSSRGCVIDGCPGRHAARGYCMRHYTRLIRRKGTDPDSPRDFQDTSDLTENEFCLAVDFRSNGFTSRDIAFELKRKVGVINEAFEYECYALYMKRKKLEE